MLRFHGSRDKVTYEHVGYNSRLDELQAAILRVQLPLLDAWADGRRAAARALRQAGLGELVSLPVPTAGCGPAWHLYVVRHDRADELAAGLWARGIGHKAYYRMPVHRQPAMRGYAAGVELPVTDELARTHLAIPMSPVLTREQAAEVTAAVRAVGAQLSGQRARRERSSSAWRPRARARPAARSRRPSAAAALAHALEEVLDLEAQRLGVGDPRAVDVARRG